MRPDEHAAHALRLLTDAAEEVADVHGDGGMTSNVVDVYRHVEYLTAAANAHAVLSLRPQAVEHPDVELTVERFEGIPTNRGAVVRATIADEGNELDGQRVILARLPCLECGDGVPWCVESGEWFGDEHLRDVEVLFPGVPS